MRKTKLFRLMLPALAVALSTSFVPTVWAGGNDNVTSNGFYTNSTNVASGNYSTASGYETQATFNFSTAMGVQTKASNRASTAMGNLTTASGRASTAMGGYTTASGKYSTAIGYYTYADCYAQTTIGQYSDNSSWTTCDPTLNSTNDNTPLFVIGNGTGVGASRSNALVVYDNGTAVFQGSVYADDGATLLGAGGGGSSYDNATSKGFYSNSTNTASGSYSTAFGRNAEASGDYSTALGNGSTAVGDFSIATGFSSEANFNYSVAMGYQTIADNQSSVAMGERTTASGKISTALGYQTTASAKYSTAMGKSTTASGQYSTAMGESTTASGRNATATGFSTTSGAYYSTASGYQTTADCMAQTTVGVLSDNSSWTNCNTGYTPSNNGSPLFVVGNGTWAGNSNAFVVYDNGTANLSGNLMVGGDVTVSSDARLKQNIVPLAGSLDKVQQLRGVSYEWMDPNRQGGRHIGFIAQEVQEVIPEVVKQNGDYLSMSYANLTAVLVEAVKEQQTEIDQLEEENNALEAENAGLRGRLESIEAVLRKAGLLK